MNRCTASRTTIVWAAIGMIGMTLWAGCGQAAPSPPSRLSVSKAPMSLPLGNRMPSATTSAPGMTPPASSSPTASSGWLTSSSARKTATLTLIAGYNQSLGGYNFNGYGNGEMTVTVPSGWKVTVKFQNHSSIQHSVAIVRNAKSTSPAFSGAGFPLADLTSGIPKGQSGSFSFTTGAPGTYRIACLVPGHEALGMWDKLVVSSGGTPSISP